ncbi:uncharacterized protein LOC116806537 [Drosophila grimshawi]|uniref:uncharacterized protein LOC116806537 n=1 Tax=Drosophila grimshawi TaxID=7222 RepID=UPI0013EF14CD|nr:uncharacterized protein LOC116806537 [Drosophila grimshawi]
MCTNKRRRPRLEKSPEMSVSKWKSPEKLQNAAVKPKAISKRQNSRTAAFLWQQRSLAALCFEECANANRDSAAAAAAAAANADNKAQWTANSAVGVNVSVGVNS